MKSTRFTLSFILAVIFINLACTKTVTETVTITIRDTVRISTVDTLEVLALDTTISANARNWSAFSYETSQLLDSGQNSFFTTAEGVKFVGQQPRLGIRIQTKSEFGFRGKNVYMKWKVFGNNQFVGIVPQLKYDPTSIDAIPFVQGIDLAYYSLNNSWNGSTLLQPDVWYYSRWIPMLGTNNYQIITSTGNYHIAGGTVVSNVTIPVYTQSGYIGLRIGDPFGGKNAYGILAECRINGK